jgi:hypothetical protein
MVVEIEEVDKWTVFKTRASGWLAYCPPSEDQCNCQYFPTWGEALAHALSMGVPA